MSTTAEWQNTADALRAEIHSLRTRLDALESAGQTAAPGEHWSDALPTSLQAQLVQDRDAQGSEYAFAVVSAVSQVSRQTHSGTALSITTFDKATDVPTLETLVRRRERALLFLSDPLVLPLLRSFHEAAFAGKPMRATADELAARVSDTAENVNAALRPLVANGTVGRSLSAEGVPFYEWDGNNPVAAALLFHD